MKYQIQMINLAKVIRLIVCTRQVPCELVERVMDWESSIGRLFSFRKDWRVYRYEYGLSRSLVFDKADSLEELCAKMCSKEGERKYAVSDGRIVVNMHIRFYLDDDEISDAYFDSIDDMKKYLKECIHLNPMLKETYVDDNLLLT